MFSAYGHGTSVVQGSQNHHRYPLIVPAQVRILLPFREAFEQLPRSFIRDAPVLAGNAGADGSSPGGVAEIFLQFEAQCPARSGGTVAMDQLDGLVARAAGGLQLKLHPKAGLFDGGHSVFEVDDLDGFRLPGHGSSVTPGTTEFKI